VTQWYQKMMQKPNATRQARPTSGARHERSVLAVACTRLLGRVERGAGRLSSVFLSGYRPWAVGTANGPEHRPWAVSTAKRPEHRPWAGHYHGPEHWPWAGAPTMGLALARGLSTGKRLGHWQEAWVPTMGLRTDHGRCVPVMGWRTAHGGCVPAMGLHTDKRLEYRRCSWGTGFLGPGDGRGDAVWLGTTGGMGYVLPSLLMVECLLPNATRQARGTSGARHERSLFPVACTR
jgi:hypothetical protein